MLLRKLLLLALVAIAVPTPATSTVIRNSDRPSVTNTRTFKPSVTRKARQRQSPRPKVRAKSTKRKSRKKRVRRSPAKRVVRRRVRSQVRRDLKHQSIRPRPPRIQSRQRPRRQQQAYQRPRPRKRYRPTSRKIPRSVPPTAPVILQEAAQWPLMELFRFRQVSPVGKAPGAITDVPHVGLDIIAAPGAVVRVSHTGRVSAINAVAGGQSILVEHNGGAFLTEYGPLSKTSVAVGQRIPQGSVLGWLRRSGSSAVLHYKRWERQDGGGYKAVPVVAVEGAVIEASDLGVALVRMIQARHLSRRADQIQ